MGHYRQVSRDVRSPDCHGVTWARLCSSSSRLYTKMNLPILTNDMLHSKQFQVVNANAAGSYLPAPTVALFGGIWLGFLKYESDLFFTFLFPKGAHDQE